jgi:DNA-binding NarL/FixJ family response regulator
MPTADGIPGDISTVALTERQREVVALIAEGATNQEIARRLGLERRTVSDHVAQILWRLGAKDRIQVAIWAARHRSADCEPDTEC